jgi:hypothetical protein
MHTQVCKVVWSTLRHDIRFFYRSHTLSNIVASVSFSCEELSPMFQHLRRKILRLTLFLNNQLIRCESKLRSMELTRHSAAFKEEKGITWDMVSRLQAPESTLFFLVGCHPIEKGFRDFTLGKPRITIIKIFANYALGRCVVSSRQSLTTRSWPFVGAPPGHSNRMVSCISAI